MAYVIFDLNRTLYDPDTDTLLPGVLETLTCLSSHGVEMHVISRNEPGRENILGIQGISHFFRTVTFVEDKTPEVFAHLMESCREPLEAMYVVGDYLHEEIRFGNQCGAKTIWLKRGKFSDLQPERPDDTPWKTITQFSEVLALIGE